MRQSSKVYVKFPKIGLGNLLLHWAKGFAFAKKYNLELYKSSWWAFRPGPWLRREKNKRVYWGYLKEDSFIQKISLFFFKLKAEKIYEPSEKVNSGKNILYIFKKFHVDGDYFKEAKPYRDELKQEIYKMLEPRLKKKLEQFDPPEIGIHIRRGDFKLGSYITPNQFFIDVITRIRKECNRNLHVTVFTDAADNELQDIFSLPNVTRAESKADILDILLLSQSKICILSISSTFSLWAGFLSEGIVIKHPEEWHPDIRPEEVNIKYFEGKSVADNEELPQLLKDNLSELH